MVEVDIDGIGTVEFSDSFKNLTKQEQQKLVNRIARENKADPNYRRGSFKQGEIRDKDEQLFDTKSGIRDASLRAALSAAETKGDEEKQLRTLYGMTEGDYIRDSRGRLAITPSGGKKLGIELSKPTLIDESGFSSYDFVDLAGIAPEVIGGVAGALKGAATGAAFGPLGAFVGGALGAGTGAATGQAAEEAVEALANVQDQTAEEVVKDLGKEFAYGFLTDATLGAFGLAGRGLKSSTKAGKGLTDDELKIAAESIESGINPTLSAIRAPSVVARQQGIVEKIFGTSPRLKQNNEVMQKKISEFRSKFGEATDEEIGELLLNGTGKAHKKALKAELDAQMAVLKTLRASADDLGAAAERNLNVRDDVFDTIIGARNEFDAQMKILFRPIDDALESAVGSEKFIPLNRIKSIADDAEDIFSSDLVGGKANELSRAINVVRALKDKESFQTLYSSRKTINDIMSEVKTNGLHWNSMKEMRDSIDSMLTVKNLDYVFNETPLGSSLASSANRNTLIKASARFKEARGKYKDGIEIFEDIEKAGVIKDLANKARSAREGNRRMDVSDVDLKKVIKNNDRKTLERTLRAVAYGNTQDAKKVSAEQFRQMISSQWLNDALETSGLSLTRDLDPTKFKGGAFAKAINDLGETADVLFGADAKAIKSLAKRIGDTNISNLDKSFVKSVMDDAGASATLKTKLQALADAQDAIFREQRSSVLKDLQTGDMNPLMAADLIATNKTTAADIKKIMNAFDGQPEVISKIQGNYMERLISDFGDTLTTDGKQLGAFAKRILDADKGGKLQAIFGEEVGKDMAQFARILDFNSRTAAGGDLVAANIAASPIQNLGKLLRFTVVGKLLQSGPYYKQIVSDYKAISEGLDPQAKAQTLGRLMASALTKAAAQSTTQELQEGVREVERQVTSIMDSSGISNQLAQLQQQVSSPNNSSSLVQPMPQPPAAPSNIRQQAAQNPGVAQALGIRGATAGLLGNP
jgi:hypothetical protein